MAKAKTTTKRRRKNAPPPTGTSATVRVVSTRPSTAPAPAPTRVVSRQQLTPPEETTPAKPVVRRRMNAKTGYARDIMPDRVESAEASGQTVPIASDAGGQEGRLRPSEREYAKGGRVLSLAETAANLSMRRNGKMDLIPDGLDQDIQAEAVDTQPSTVGEPNSATDVEPQLVLTRTPDGGAAVQYQQDDPNDFDPLSDDPQPGDLEAEEKALDKAAQVTHLPAIAAIPGVITSDQVAREYNPQAEGNKNVGYMAQRVRVTLGLETGDMVITAIDVAAKPYAVTIVLPFSSEGVTFIPKPGTELVISVEDKRYPCFFPGTYCELAELGLTVMSFVRAEEG